MVEGQTILHHFVLFVEDLSNVCKRKQPVEARRPSDKSIEKLTFLHFDGFLGLGWRDVNFEPVNLLSDGRRGRWVGRAS